MIWIMNLDPAYLMDLMDHKECGEKTIIKIQNIYGNKKVKK
jgi:hypothetical protein